MQINTNKNEFHFNYLRAESVSDGQIMHIATGERLVLTS